MGIKDFMTIKGIIAVTGPVAAAGVLLVAGVAGAPAIAGGDEAGVALGAPAVDTDELDRSRGAKRVHQLGGMGVARTARSDGETSSKRSSSSNVESTGSPETQMGTSGASSSRSVRRSASRSVRVRRVVIRRNTN